MYIVIAPDSFKGNCNSRTAAEAIERGILKIFPEMKTHIVPVADGGEGTVKAAVAAGGGYLTKSVVQGPLVETVTAEFGMLPGRSAVIEMAAASGLTLIPENRRNPMETSTFGTGQLVKAALDEGCTKIMIGIGGSSTTDCGIGMAAALGVRFLDENGDEVPLSGKGLSLVRHIDISRLDSRLRGCSISAACDVKNPLYGPEGAAYVYSPQKGADLSMVKKLDAGLMNIAEKIKEQLNIDVAGIPGAGAAGGLGAGIVAFLGGRLIPGIDAILDTVRFEEIIKTADLVITGEGKIDGQSIYGKVPVGIAVRAKKFGIPVIAIVGNIGENASAVYEYGIDAVISTVNRAMPLETAMKEGLELLEETGERVMRILKIGKIMNGFE